MQIAIFDVLNYFYESGWETFIVGGTLRDLMVWFPQSGRRTIIPRDIDLIVNAPSVTAIEAVIPKELIRRKTSFGGLHLVKQVLSRCELHFDVWPLVETWAFKEFKFSPNISDFPKTPFLNLDAIAMELFPRGGCPRRIFENGFFEGIQSRLLDINFEPNPFPDVCAIRSLIVAAKSRFQISRRLATFIISRRDKPAFLDRWMHAQIAHYGQVRCTEGELVKWLTEIEYQLHSGCEKITVPVSNGRQLGLWLDYPPFGDRCIPNLNSSERGDSHTIKSNRECGDSSSELVA
jgi:hypothetical protein